MEKNKAVTTFLVIATVLAIMDLWTKAAVFEFLGTGIVMPETEEGFATLKMGQLHTYSVIDGYFELEAALNRGAYNGWFKDMRWFLVPVSALWVLGTLLFVACKPKLDPLLVVALGITAGGAFGNLWDRYFYGVVRDFIKWFVVIDGNESVWPNFNIADASILIGVGLILIREFRIAKKLKKEAAQKEAGPEETS